MDVETIRVVIVSMYLKMIRTSLFGSIWNTAQRENSTCNNCRRDRLVIGSSEQVHVVDALAITGDEGRGSLRKAPGSWQTSFDPGMSEWGNPLRMEYP